MPKLETTNITLGVTDTTGIDFSVTVLAYPSPQYKLQREDGAIDNIMQNSIYMNAVNNFTLRFNKNIVDQSDFGIYNLIVSNPFGVATIFILVLPQSKISVFPFNIKKHIMLSYKSSYFLTRRAIARQPFRDRLDWQSSTNACSTPPFKCT